MSQNKSLAEILALMPEQQRMEALNGLTDDTKAALLYNWRFNGRPEQFAPEGNWATWLALAGRGFGKTKLGAEWVRENVCGATPLAPGKHKRVHIVAETAADARDVIVEGPSGILAVHPPEFRPTYEVTKRRLTWPNGAIATMFNATEPDQLRGPQCELLWMDEMAKFRYIQETYDMAMFGLRLGSDPRTLITTTPRSLPLLREIMAHEDTVTTRGSTLDNRSNLSSKFIKGIFDRYDGTRLGRQELYGDFVDDVPGALFTRDMFDRNRRKLNDRLPPMTRVMVAIDPAAKASVASDDTAETGIIVVGLGVDGKGYVIDDVSCRLPPAGWARMAVSVYNRYQADAIVAEVNQGGDMVEAVIHAENPRVKVIKVRASKGKVVRAEPVSALYAQNRICHVGNYPILEDQMVLFTAFGILGGTASDRTDALVWGLTQLFPSFIRASTMVDHEHIQRVPRRMTYGRQGANSTTGY